MPMEVKIWGARGSLPAPHTPAHLEKRFHDLFLGFFEAGYRNRSDLKKYIEGLPKYMLGGFGGNTPCVEVSTPDSRVIVDGGSGIRTLGYDLMLGPCGKGQGEVHLFFTHFHWDHLIGLPFFTPIFIPGNKIHVYAVQPELKRVFETVFQKPFFPVPLQHLGAEIIYHTLEPRKPFRFRDSDLIVTPFELDHPDPCWGFRFEHKGRVYSHCVDTEAVRVTREELGPDLPLYQGVHLMIFDAQYTLLETIEKVNWGHAAASIGLDIAMREGVRRVLFMHHDPASTDERIAAAEGEARRYYERQLAHLKKAKAPVSEVEWGFAYEGMVVEV